MNADTAKQFIAEKDAQRIRVGVSAFTGDKELTRFFPEVPPKKVDETIQFMFEKTSVLNGSQKLKYVDGPMSDNEKHPGRWRMVTAYADTRDEVSGITQVLRLGLGTTFAWDETRIVQHTDVGSDEEVIVLLLPNLDPNKTDAIVASLSSTYDAITVRGEERAGTWYVNNAVASTVETQDNSGQIVLQLSKAEYSISSKEDFGTLSPGTTTVYYGVPKDRIVTVLQAFTGSVGERQVKEARILGYDQRGRATILGKVVDIECVDKDAVIQADSDTQQSIYMKFNALVSEIDPFIKEKGLDEASEGQQNQLFVQNNGNKTYNLLGITKSLGASAIGTSFNVGESCDTLTQYQFYWNKTLAQAEEILDDYAEQTPGVEKSVRVSRKGDGAYDIMVIIKTMSAKTLPAFSVASAYGIKETYEFGWNLTEAQLNALKNKYASEEEGKKKDVKISRDKNCLYSFVGVVWERTNNKPTLSFTLDKYSTVEEYEYRWYLTSAEFNTFKADYGSQVSGTTHRVEIMGINDDHTVNVVGVRIATVTHGVAQHVSTETMLFEEKRTVTRSQVAPPSSTQTPEVGLTKIIRADPNGVGEYDVEDIERRSREKQTDDDLVLIETGPTRNVWARQTRNARDLPDVSGIKEELEDDISTVSAQIQNFNDDQTYEILEMIVTPVPPMDALDGYKPIKTVHVEEKNVEILRNYVPSFSSNCYIWVYQYSRENTLEVARKYFTSEPDCTVATSGNMSYTKGREGEFWFLERTTIVYGAYNFPTDLLHNIKISGAVK